MDVFVVRAYQPGFADRLEIAGAVADDMADDRHAGLPGKGPIIGIRGGVELERQQLVGR